MRHSYNKLSFNVAATDHSNLLLSLYCSLVVLELTIKEHIHQSSGSWTGGHNIIDWLTNDLAESSLGLQLSTKLSALYCTSRSGSDIPVDATRYPDIRYLQHETDFLGKSTDNQIQEALDIVNDIKTRLMTRGIM